MPVRTGDMILDGSPGRLLAVRGWLDSCKLEPVAWATERHRLARRNAYDVPNDARIG